MRTAASSACVYRSSPISEHIYRRLAASSQHARQISSQVSIRLRRSTSTSRAWGAGEAGAVGAPPAVINAIVDALHRRVGLRHIDMPATPRRVWELLNGI